MTNKEKYQLFCEENKDIPIFSRWWWLEGVTNGSWDVLLYERNHVILGSLPYYITLKENKTVITKPPMTQNNGIYVKYPNNTKAVEKINLYNKIVNGLLDQLEQLNIEYYEQNFHYSITNWLPMFWRGYHEVTRYTYVIEDTRNLDEVVREFSASARWVIRKAEKEIQLYEDITPEEFYMINEKSFIRQNLKIPYSYEVFKRLDDVCVKQGCRKIFYAMDELGNVHAANYYVWDDFSVYYLLGGADPKYRSSQAQTLLIYEGIKLAHKLGKKFDFEGSVLPHVEPFVRRFGGIPKPYFRIWKDKHS